MSWILVVKSFQNSCLEMTEKQVVDTSDKSTNSGAIAPYCTILFSLSLLSLSFQYETSGLSWYFEEPTHDE